MPWKDTENLERVLLSERSQSEGLNILLLQLYDILEKKKSDGDSKKISSYQQFEVGRVGRETRMNRQGTEDF